MVMSSAWAKLGSLMTASVNVRPSAISAYMLPTCSVRTSESIKSVVVKKHAFIRG